MKYQGGWLAAWLLVAASLFALGPLPVIVILSAAAALWLLLRHSQVRIGWFALGALLVFQSSDEITGQKLAYLAGAALAGGISAIRVSRSDTRWLKIFTPVIIFTLGTWLVLAASLITARQGNADIAAWLRDVSPYALLAIAPAIALDAAHDLSERSIEKLILLAGAGGAVGFTSDWLDRRGVSALPFGRLLLGTLTLAAAGFAIAITRGMFGPGRVKWALAASAIPTVMLTTGTRTIVAFVAAFPAMIGRRDQRRIGAWRALATAVSVLGVVALTAPWLAARIASRSGWFQQRVQAALTVLNGESSTDQSYQGRSRAYDVVSERILENPWLGVGPGNLRLEMSLDTPLITVLKFGIPGSLVIVGILVASLVCARKAAEQYGYQLSHTSLRVFAFIIVAMVPFGSPLEDKGFATAVALMLCVVAVAARKGTESSTAVDSSPCNPSHPQPCLVHGSNLPQGCLAGRIAIIDDKQ